MLGVETARLLSAIIGGLGSDGTRSDVSRPPTPDLFRACPPWPRRYVSDIYTHVSPLAIRESAPAGRNDGG